MRLKKKHRQTIYIAILSLASHLMLLAGFINYSDQVIDSCSNTEQAKVIKTYLYSSLPVPAGGSKPFKRKSDLPMVNRDYNLKEKTIKSTLLETMAVDAADKTHSRSTVAASNENQTNALLALLHEAIQKQQEYPISAQQMGRQGRVTVSFILKPNGQITQLHIVRSSETASLDEAALSAVSKAAPFIGVDKYFTRPQVYSIDVVFDLD